MPALDSEGRQPAIHKDVAIYDFNSPACIVHAKVFVVGRPLQIRNVPEPVLETLRERADEVHMSLAAYVLEVLTQHVATKSMSQVLAGPRLRDGRPLADREIHDLISRGRR